MNYKQNYEIKCLICHNKIVSTCPHDICRECEKDFRDPDKSTLTDYIAKLRIENDRLQEVITQAHHDLCLLMETLESK